MTLETDMERLRALPPLERTRALLAESQAAADGLAAMLAERGFSVNPPLDELPSDIQAGLYRMVCATAIMSEFGLISEPDGALADDLAAKVARRVHAIAEDLIGTAKGGDA